MTIVDLCALLNATAAATLGGLAFGYASWVHREGNGQRRWMIWLGPVWGAVALYHAGVWVADAFYPTINTFPLLRPVGWLAFAIPALVLFRAIAEDKRKRQQQKQDQRILSDKLAEVEMSLRG